MENIFEGAKFGDKFITRGGDIALYHLFNGVDTHLGVVNVSGNLRPMSWSNDGKISEFINKSKFDIVSKYKEPIDEEKLQKRIEEI